MRTTVGVDVGATVGTGAVVAVGAGVGDETAVGEGAAAVHDATTANEATNVTAIAATMLRETPLPSIAVNDYCRHHPAFTEL